MSLESIGFYTLSDARAAQVSVYSPLWRCELILTSRCNFNCPYCRHVGGTDIPLDTAQTTLTQWIGEGLRNVRFSGGEPTMYEGLGKLVAQAKAGGVQRIAISTNGSASLDTYLALLDAGVNDFSISLDACCAATGDTMSGTYGMYQRIIDNITALSARTYVSVGVVLTDTNHHELSRIIVHAHNCGVADIRIISAAQSSLTLTELTIPREIRQKHPILDYRLRHLEEGISLRGLSPTDCSHCPLVLDDMVVIGEHHYPCVIYAREGGQPIGTMGMTFRADRLQWMLTHNTHTDPICSRNCLDVCRDYNNTVQRLHTKEK